MLLLGSSALRLAAGASESLARRFMLHRRSHWPWHETREAFGWSLALKAVTKPALLSYTKMLGQLQDAGNTTTLAGYLRLLEAALLVSGLERFSPGGARQRGSSPKLILWSNALVSALDLRTFDEARADATWSGRLVEKAVGAHLVNHLRDGISRVSWWRSRGDEVDFVVERGGTTWALEVKSSRSGKPRGLEPFGRHVPDATPVIVGPGGLELRRGRRRTGCPSRFSAL